ncbi:hypothetical protein COP2_030602 [Malus domestica]
MAVTYALKILGSSGSVQLEWKEEGIEAVVLVVEIECVFELSGAAILGAGDPEGVELVEANEAIVVSVKIDHDALKLVTGDVGAEGLEVVVELVDRDLAIVVGIKAFEDLLDLVGDDKFGVGRGWALRAGPGFVAGRFGQ